MFMIMGGHQPKQNQKSYFFAVVFTVISLSFEAETAQQPHLSLSTVFKYCPFRRKERRAAAALL